MSEHGHSMITFMNLIKDASTTVILVEDEHGHKFGAMCFDEWKHKHSFYGTGESFVFTFHDTDECKVYLGTGNNSMYQFCDKKCIGVGGDKQGGRFALYIGDDFDKGSSNKTKCYNNEVLSSQPNFICTNLEVWGFE